MDIRAIKNQRTVRDTNNYPEENTAIKNAQEGSIVEAAVIQNGEQAAVQIGSRRVALDPALLPDAKAGDKVYLKITDLSADKIAMKIVNPQEEMAAEGSRYTKAAKTEIARNTAAFAKQLSGSGVPVQVEMSVKDAIAAAGSRFNDALAKQLDQQGLTLDQVDLKALASLEMPPNETATADKHVVEQVNHAMEQVEQLLPVKEGAIRYLIQNDQTVTLDHLYKAQYSTSTSQSVHQISRQEWQELKPQIDKMIETAGLTDQQSAYDGAKWLLENDLAVTPDNLKKWDQIEQMNHGKWDQEQAAKNLTDAALHQENLTKADLVNSNLSEQSYQLLERIAHISDQAIERAVNSGKKITLHSLLEIQKQLDDGMGEAENSGQKGPAGLDRPSNTMPETGKGSASAGLHPEAGNGELAAAGGPGDSRPLIGSEETLPPGSQTSAGNGGTVSPNGLVGTGTGGTVLPNRPVGAGNGGTIPPNWPSGAGTGGTIPPNWPSGAGTEGNNPPNWPTGTGSGGTLPPAWQDSTENGNAESVIQESQTGAVNGEGNPTNGQSGIESGSTSPNPPMTNPSMNGSSNYQEWEPFAPLPSDDQLEIPAYNNPISENTNTAQEDWLSGGSSMNKHPEASTDSATPSKPQNIPYEIMPEPIPADHKEITDFIELPGANNSQEITDSLAPDAPIDPIMPKDPHLENSQSQNREEDRQPTSQQSLKQNEVLHESKAQSDLADVDLRTITAKRQLEELRLKMTVEAGRTMLSKHISIETSQLSTLVEQLRSQEDQLYQKELALSGMQATNTELPLLKQAMNQVGELAAMPSYALGRVLHQVEQVTIEKLNQEGRPIQKQLQEAMESYDTMSTEIRPDLGDSIQTAFRNVDHILESMQLEPTKANQRAIRILGYNSIDITEDNVATVKYLDQQVTTCIEQMKPHLVLQMIREGVNPIDTPIQELNEQLMAQNEAMGSTSEDSYSEFLYQLDHTSGITPEERKSYIGMFRTLYQVQKFQGRDIGALVKQGAEVTLNHLLTAQQTIKNPGIETTIDDKFGGMAEVSWNGETIRQQIQAAYHKTTAKSIVDHMTPQALRDSSENLMNLPLERLNEMVSDPKVQMQAQSAKAEYRKIQSDQIRELSTLKQEAAEILSDYAQPVSLSNLQAAKSLISYDNTFYKEIKKQMKVETQDTEPMEQAMEGMEEGLHSIEGMQQAIRQLEQVIDSQADRMLESDAITGRDLTSLKQIRTGMQLRHALSQEERYEIPINIDGETITMSLRFIRNDKEKGSLSAAVETKTLGCVNANLEVKGDKVSGYLGTDAKQGLQTLQDSKQEWKNMLDEIGLTSGTITIGQEDQSRLYHGVKNQKQTQEAATNQLYRLSRQLVSYIKKLENSQPALK